MTESIQSTLGQIASGASKTDRHEADRHASLRHVERFENDRSNPNHNHFKSRAESALAVEVSELKSDIRFLKVTAPNDKTGSLARQLEEKESRLLDITAGRKTDPEEAAEPSTPPNRHKKKGEHEPDMRQESGLPEKPASSVTGACGNRCEHNRFKPRLDIIEPPKKGKGGLPAIISIASDQMNKYYDAPHYLHELNAANGSERQQRSERRQACILLMKSALKHMDIGSAYVACPSRNYKEGYMFYDVEYLANDADISARRAFRALHDLKEAEYITSLDRAENGKARSSVKQITFRFFKAIGLGKLFESERQKRKRQNKADFKRSKKAKRKEAVQQTTANQPSLPDQPGRPDPERKTTEQSKACHSSFREFIKSKLGWSSETKEEPQPASSADSDEFERNREKALQALQAKLE